MTIKARIALGIAFLLTVIVLLGVLANYYLSRIEIDNVEAFTQHLAHLRDLQELDNHLDGLLIGVEADDEPELLEDLTNVHQASLALTEGEFPEDETTERLRNIQRWILQVEQFTADFQGAEPDNRTAEKLQLLSAVSSSQMAVSRLEREAQQKLSTSFAGTTALTERARRQMIFLGGVCALFAVLVLMWLPNYVTAPIKKFAKSISSIAEGDFSTRLRVDRRDEFGQLALSFNEMASQLESYSAQNVNELITSRNRLETLVDHLDDFILGMDTERRIVFINTPMANYLGVDAQEVMGQYMPDLALTNPRVSALFQPIALGLRSAIEPISYTDSQNKTYFLQERVVRLSREEASGLTNEGEGYIILLSDVTDYEEKTTRQTDFLATLSHEMKTPIAAIKMSVNLLEDTRLGELDEDQLELTQTIKSNNQRLLRMINEVLRLSQNEAGETTLQLQQLELPSVYDRARERLITHARNKSIKLSLITSSDLPIIEGDMERLSWVISNLLSNSIRYAPFESTITTTIRPVAGGVQLSVSDEGTGIAVADRERIFEKYARAANDKTKGTGLGLAICREYIEAHGGRIYVDPTYNTGARLVVELPRRMPEQLREQHQTALAD